ncbi:MAG: S24 family peptidase [Arenicellales bacterium]|nr:S24 family peptidase [Arenicellales bacterium]
MTACSGSEPYALRVLGDSMEPEFKEGEVIVIEPQLTAEEGAYVVALHDNDFLFRQLSRENDRWYLKPLNSRYPTIELHNKDSIKGRIISKSSGKGRQTKSYL